jgi:pyrroline-5-carboxylate reductase
MGGAMLAGWREHGLSSAVAVDPALPQAPGPDVLVVPDEAAVPADFSPAAVVLAVKPQMADAALPQLARYARSAVMLSVMAGRTVAGLRRLFGGDAAIVRAMPNTPAAIRLGITVAFASLGVSSDQRALCHRLLHAIGEVAWVDDEALIDPVTAVSGGGPAYVFLLAELLEKAAIEQGIPPDLARLMARKTVSGSGALLAASSEDASALRRAVTSPKGTTERALAVLMADNAWPKLISQAITAATERSRELAG